MISYALLLGHVAPAPVPNQAKPRKVVAKEMAGSVADQRDSNSGRMKIAARNRARILEFLRSHGPTGKAALCEALADLSYDQIDSALFTLREQKLVRIKGQRRSSVWVAIDKKP